MLRRWSQPGDGVVIHTPAYDAFYKVIEGNQRRVMALPLSQRDGEWQCDMAALEALLASPQCKILLLCSPHNPIGKKVAIMPGSTYGESGRGWLRFNVGCPRSKVDDGLDRLIAALHNCLKTRA